MSRNGSGTYSVVNTFVSGTTITATGHNQNWADVAVEMTNSVAVDGQSTMTGPLKAASGTVAAPSFTFGSDTDSGIYRKGSNNIGVGVAGAEVIDVSTTGINVTGSVKQGGFALLPVGLGPLPWSGSSAPSGWVLCYGQTLSRATYAALWTFAAVEIAAGNTLYGAGDGSTTFTITDMRGGTTFGQDDMGGSAASRLTTANSGVDGATLGAVGGIPNPTIVTGNLPAYTPAGSVSVTSVASDIIRVNAAFSSAVGGGTVTAFTAGTVSAGAQTSTGTLTGTAQGGVSTPVKTQPRTVVTNYIIFAGV